jgi:hypothetical protein
MNLVARGKIGQNFNSLSNNANEMSDKIGSYVSLNPLRSFLLSRRGKWAKTQNNTRDSNKSHELPQQNVVSANRLPIK